jgi:hypothetical protein
MNLIVHNSVNDTNWLSHVLENIARFKFIYLSSQV